MGNCSDKRSQKTYIDPVSLDLNNIEALSKGKPINVTQGLNVRKNLQTNKLQGVPIQWAKKYKLPLQVDLNKTVSTDHLPRETRPADELPNRIIEFIQKRQENVRCSYMTRGSNVYNSRLSSSSRIFQQKLSANRSSKYGIKNLPSSLIQQLTNSQISQDITQPQQLIQIIYLQDQPLDQSKHGSKLLSTNQFLKILSKVQIIQGNPGQKFNFIQQLSTNHNQMCQVFRTSSKLNQNIIYATKIMKLTQRRTQQKIKQQIAAMQMCYSQNIIDYAFTYKYKQSLFIFMQYMHYGPLTNFIRYYHIDKKTKIPQGTIRFIIFEILKGLTCIHSRWQIHRDLKSDNILINKNAQIKISDFGYALQFTKEKTSCMEIVGTPAWMAPELIMKKDYNQTVDIWSLGIILTELINGEPKYLRMKPLKAMYMIVSQKPPLIDDCSFQMRVFMNKCLQKNPMKRASIKQLLYDPFVRNINYVQEKERFKKLLYQSKNIKV